MSAARLRTSTGKFDFRSPHRGRHRRVDHRFHCAGGFYIERGTHRPEKIICGHSDHEEGPIVAATAARP
jgi:hypothetical protein